MKKMRIAALTCACASAIMHVTCALAGVTTIHGADSETHGEVEYTVTNRSGGVMSGIGTLRVGTGGTNRPYGYFQSYECDGGLKDARLGYVGRTLRYDYKLEPGGSGRCVAKYVTFPKDINACGVEFYMNMGTGSVTMSKVDQTFRVIHNGREEVRRVGTADFAGFSGGGCAPTTEKTLTVTYPDNIVLKPKEKKLLVSVEGGVALMNAKLQGISESEARIVDQNGNRLDGGTAGTKLYVISLQNQKGSTSGAVLVSVSIP
ncbi:Uncharacterised protein [Escherichia coli]|nr:Uncharacterised protein [Escherichia coli]